jgi:hypothetical protein
MVSGRAKFIDVMEKYPQRCIITNNPNSNNQLPALDLGQDLPNYGHLYVSDIGMKWLAEQFNYVPRSEMNEELNKLKTELIEANKKIENLESAISRIPEAVEGMLNGLKQLSIDTINNLVSVGDVFPDRDDDVVVEERDENGDGDDIVPIVTSRRNGKATSK